MRNGEVHYADSSTSGAEKHDVIISDVRKSLLKDGYALVDEAAGLNFETSAASASKLRNAIKTGIEQLVLKEKLPATFILLFDETWELCRKASKNILNFDLLAWYIDPSNGDAGFSPHRDRQPTEIESSFHISGSNSDVKETYGIAKYVTMWMALSNATPENSCLYVIPAGNDPGYYNGDNEDDLKPDPLQSALCSKVDFQTIRALPRREGESVVFTHRILHWGSKGNVNCKEPRIALSFVVSAMDFEEPYISSSYLTEESLPPFHIRLLLVCAQLLIYHQRFDLSPKFIRSCYDYCTKYEDILNKSYFKKIRIEFISAMKENPRMLVDQPLPFDPESGESDDDAVLQAMLDADAEGQFVEDDFEGVVNEDSADEYEVEDDDNDSFSLFDVHINKKSKSE